MKRLIIFLFGWIFIQSNAQIIGLCIDTSNAPITGIEIYDKTIGKVGQGKMDGYFKLDLKPGNYQLIFSHPEFFNMELAVVYTEKYKDTLTLILKRKVASISTVYISAKWKDPGPDYMKKAIKRRDYWSKKIPAQSADVYIRAFEEIKSTRKKYSFARKQNR